MKVGGRQKGSCLGCAISYVFPNNLGICACLRVCMCVYSILKTLNPISLKH